MIGGSIEIGESPAEAALREASEEAGIDVALGAILAAVGGPGFELEYASGDRVAYVSVVYEATVSGGDPLPDGDEVTETRWFGLDEFRDLGLNSFAVNLLTEIGYWQHNQ